MEQRKFSRNSCSILVFLYYLICKQGEVSRELNHFCSARPASQENRRKSRRQTTKTMMSRYISLRFIFLSVGLSFTGWLEAEVHAFVLPNSLMDGRATPAALNPPSAETSSSLYYLPVRGLLDNDDDSDEFRTRKRDM